MNDLGVEVCCTLGMLTADQAHRLEDAGLYAYNHNLDTSARVLRRDHHDAHLPGPPRHDRQPPHDEHHACAAAGSSGWGSRPPTASSFLHTLATLDPHPESVPINVLSSVPGTPLADAADVAIDETVRMIATGPDPDADVDGAHRGGPSPDELRAIRRCASSPARTRSSRASEGMMLTEAVPCAEHDGDAALLARLGLHPRVLVT